VIYNSSKFFKLPISVGIVPKIFSEAKALRKKERKKEKGYS